MRTGSQDREQLALSPRQAALQALGLQPGRNATPPRTWPQRQRACRRLLRRQAGWLLLQAATLALALALLVLVRT